DGGQVGTRGAPAGAVDAEQVLCATRIHTKESIEHGGDENRAAEVRVIDFFVDVVGVGPAPKRGAQATLGAAGLTELNCQLDQRVGLRYLSGQLRHVRFVVPSRSDWRECAR